MTAATSRGDSTPGAQISGVSKSVLRWYAACALLGGLVGGAVAYAIAPLLPASYSAVTEIVLGSPGKLAVLNNSVASPASTNAASAAQVLRSYAVAAGTSNPLHGRLTANDVTQDIAVASSNSSPVVTVTATASSPELARDLANAIPQAYVAVEAQDYADRAKQTAAVLQQVLANQQKRLAGVQAQLTAKTQSVAASASGLATAGERASFVQNVLNSDVDYQLLRNEAADLATKINDTSDAIQETGVDSASLQSGVDHVIPAQLPDASGSGSRQRITTFGIVIGIFVGALIAWRITDRRRSVDPAEAAATLRAPLLGSIGHDRRLHRGAGFVDLSADSPLVNELKVIASSLVSTARRRNLAAVVVASAHRGEGTSVLARNLAAAGDYIGQSMLLIDAGLGETTTAVLDLEDSPGLAEMVEGAPLARVTHYIPYDNWGRMPVVPVGMSRYAIEPGRRLNEARREHWTRALADGEGLMPLVDAPAVNEHPAALQLAVGGGLVVIASARTTLADLEVIRNRADVADVRVIGFIVNEFAPRRGLRRHRRSHVQERVRSNVVIDHGAVMAGEPAEAGMVDRRMSPRTTPEGLVSETTTREGSHQDV